MVEQNNIKMISPYLVTMQKAALDASKIVMEGFNNINDSQCSQKTDSPNDTLTIYDKKSQDIITSALNNNYPDFKIIAEENPTSVPKGWNNGYTWVIDPIDGTLSYRYGQKEFAISIGLLKDKIPIAGLIYAPARQELYYSAQGKGAYLNGKRITVRSNALTKKPLFYFGLNGITNPNLYAELQPIAAQIGQYSGSAALNMAHLAAGMIDGLLITKISIWDIAAGCSLISEAGGIIYEPNGRRNYLSPTTSACNIVAGSDFATEKILGDLPKLKSDGVQFGLSG